MDGLTHPRDLEAWHRWQLGRQPLRRRLGQVAGVLRTIARPDARPGALTLTRGGPGPVRLLVCLESRSPTSALALLGPLRTLPALEGVAVLAPEPVKDLLPPWVWTESTVVLHDDVPRLAAEASVVLSTGHYLPVGRAARDAVSEPHRFVTAQHGLLTPDAPPLAEGSTLLAWSAADAAFWASGRTDLPEPSVIGSQLLWDAGAPPRAEADPAARPVFLGQLHGAELPRDLLVRAAETFCRETGATYRPHPSERDRDSRRTHARFEAEGIVLDRSGTPLRELGAPVVAAFSTGVLEAAAAGLPAFVHCPDPPAWLTAFWHRYGLAPWGGDPTPSPERPAVEPSRAAAEVISGMMAG
ncbi:RNA-binding protein [Phycicoccus sonneratiae]|uniref:RNA-binding protein n=1 Tax=Phycicoccus sonneratiae TaxID=2807628 RepID=A0ABS2CGY4_9MICO|nr:RNA-binding protein [Phycicoccus sonneraticus]MBM6399137.1 RNA-binding protein [Phycicoccus sonneraticus]